MAVSHHDATLSGKIKHHVYGRNSASHAGARSRRRRWSRSDFCPRCAADPTGMKPTSVRTRPRASPPASTRTATGFRYTVRRFQVVRPAEVANADTFTFTVKATVDGQQVLNTSIRTRLGDTHVQFGHGCGGYDSGSATCGWLVQDGSSSPSNLGHSP